MGIDTSFYNCIQLFPNAIFFFRGCEASRVEANFERAHSQTPWQSKSVIRIKARLLCASLLSREQV